MGLREGVLRRLIEVYKYHSVRSACFELADLLKAFLSDDYVLVPLPTIGRHVRERGFDHIELICKKTGLRLEKALARSNNAVQVGANKRERVEQAKTAYIAKNVEPERNYLLVDDVWTTGASMMAACEQMRLAGAKRLSIAVIAKSSS